jgi:hypothetical protein
MSGIYKFAQTSNVELTHALVEVIVTVTMSSMFIPWELFMIPLLEFFDINSQTGLEINKTS